MDKLYITFKAIVAAVVISVLFAFQGFVTNTQAQTTNVKTFNKRVGTPQPPNGVFNIRGDFTIIGNTNLTLQSYTDTKPNTDNPMIYVDVDGDQATVNSSKSTLVFSQENGADPNCSNVLYAGLYWTGKSRTGDGNSFEVSNSNVLESKEVSNESQTATNGQAIDYSNFSLAVSRAGTNGNYYPRYTLIVGETTYWIEYTNASSDRVRFSTNGGATWVTPAGQTHSSSGNDKTATFSPIVVTQGTMTFSIDRLRGNSSPFGNAASYSNASNDLRLSANGSFDSPIQQTLDKRKIKIKGPSATAYTEFTATDANVLYPSNQYDDIYVGYRDITQYVKDHGVGEYAVADLALREGTDVTSGLFGQWAMVVVYENSKMPWRDVTLFDGYSHITPVDFVTYEEGIIAISGFNAAPTGDVNVKLGIMAAEGDIAYDDFLQIEKGVGTDTWKDLAHPKTTAGNFLNSSIYTPVLNSSGILVENPRTPALENNTGMDIAMWNIDNGDKSIITNGQSSTRFKYGTSMDRYVLYFFAFAVDAYVPDIEGLNQIQAINGVSVVGNPNPTVQPGQELTYTLDIRNRGTEAVTGGEIVIPMPYTASFVSSSVMINYSPANAEAPVFDPTRGSTGSIVWNIGAIPKTVDPEEVLARLTYTIKATENCFLLTHENCEAFVSVNGAISGKGVTSLRNFQGVSLVQGYSDEDVCEGEPIKDPLVIPIVGAEAWVAANCAGEDLFLNFEFCNVAQTGIPVSQIRDSFPVGTLFYNTSDPQTAVEYNDNHPFPRSGGTFYAIPPNSSTCTFTFNIVVNLVTTNPGVPGMTDLTFCQGAAAADLNSIVKPSNFGEAGEYEVYFYTQAAGGTALTTLIPSTATAGVREYWVAEGPSPQCIGNRVKITVAVSPMPNVPVTTVTQPTCDMTTGSIEIKSPDQDTEYALDPQFERTGIQFGNLAPGEYLIYARRMNTGCVVTSTVVIHTQPTCGQPEAPSPLQIIANDDDFGSHVIAFGGVIGNILDNDLLDGVRPDPSDVDFEFTELDGIIGLLISENGELSLIPGVNGARNYRLKYILRETAFPENNDDALVSFRILDDQVDLSVSKEALQDKVFEGDLLDYRLVVRNVGTTDATNVTVTDDIPASVAYQSFVVTENTSGVTVTPTISGNHVTFGIPVLRAGESVTIQIRVKAGTKGVVVNTAVVDSNQDDLNESDNMDSDQSEILMFRIPNVITPNNDGKNEVFEIQGLGKYASNKLTILNRYGDHVLERENYRNDWSAAGQAAGTYFYILQVTDALGNSTEFKGWIQVIKE